MYVQASHELRPRNRIAQTEIETGVYGSRDCINSSQTSDRLAIHRLKIATDIQVITDLRDVEHDSRRANLEVPIQRSGCIELRNAPRERRNPVSFPTEETTTHIEAVPRIVRLQRHDAVVQDREEVLIDLACIDVISKEIRLVDNRVIDELYLLEVTAHKDAVADLGMGTHLTIEHDRNVAPNGLGYELAVVGRCTCIRCEARHDRRHSSQRSQERQHWEHGLSLSNCQGHENCLRKWVPPLDVTVVKVGRCRTSGRFRHNHTAIWALRPTKSPQKPPRQRNSVEVNNLGGYDERLGSAIPLRRQTGFPRN